jgi:hypothetical protein
VSASINQKRGNIRAFFTPKKNKFSKKKNLCFPQVFFCVSSGPKTIYCLHEMRRLANFNWGVAKGRDGAGLPDFSCDNLRKWKNTPNENKMYLMVIKYPQCL